MKRNFGRRTWRRYMFHVPKDIPWGDSSKHPRKRDPTSRKGEDSQSREFQELGNSFDRHVRRVPWGKKYYWLKLHARWRRSPIGRRRIFRHNGRLTYGNLDVCRKRSGPTYVCPWLHTFKQAYFLTSTTTYSLRVQDGNQDQQSLE